MSGYIVWERLAPKYNRLWVQKYSLAPTRRRVVDLLKGIYQDTANFKILDIGCGTGQLAQEVTDYFKAVHYVGIDVSKNMIDEAVSRNLTGRVVFTHQAIEAVDEQIGKFDVVICTHAFPYFPNKKQVINKVCHMLNQNGSFIIANASENSLYDKIAFFFLKFTTSKSEYLSKSKIVHMLKQSNFSNIRIGTIKEKFFMPTICFITARKRKIDEDIID